MKGSAFVLTLLIAGLAVAGLWVCTVANPGVSFASLKIQKAGQTLLADRIETDDSVTYTTDPDLEKAKKKEDREEKEKEANSWKMLQHMELYAPWGNKPSSTGQGASPSQ